MSSRDDTKSLESHCLHRVWLLLLIDAGMHQIAAQASLQVSPMMYLGITSSYEFVCCQLLVVFEWRTGSPHHQHKTECWIAYSNMLLWSTSL